MNINAYRSFWDSHCDSTRATETLLTADPERLEGRYLRATLDTLFRHVPRNALANMTVVDFGCGTGRLARHIAPLCKRLLLVDVSDVALNVCRDRFGKQPNVTFLKAESPDWLLPESVDFVYSYAALSYFNDADAFWRTVAGIDQRASNFCLHFHNDIDESPNAEKSLELLGNFADSEFYRPAPATLERHYPSSSHATYFVEMHAPDVRGQDPFFYKSCRAVEEKKMPAPAKPTITAFHTDGCERQTVAPICNEALRRGYEVRYSSDLSERAQIGIYCQHACTPNADVSVIMLHDMAQRHDVWPAFWTAEPWRRFDIGILPGYQWVERWQSQTGKPSSRCKLGIFDLGWPKADLVYENREAFAQEVTVLRQRLGLKHERSVLYAPSWENHGKQDNFVRELKSLPVNLLLKQAPWSDAYPEVLANIRDMNALHASIGDNVYIVDINVSIMYCLGLADIIVSDESSVLVEALLLDVPGIAVTDWLVPDRQPPRLAEAPYDFVYKTPISGLRTTVESILAAPDSYRQYLNEKKAASFSHLGCSSTRVMDVIESVIAGTPLPYAPLTPMFELHEVARYREAELLIAQDQHTAGRKILVELAEGGSTHWAVYNDLGVLAYGSGDLMEAARIFEYAAALSDTATEPRRNLAATYTASGQHEAAIGVYGQLLHIEQNNPDILEKLRGALEATRALSGPVWKQLLNDLRVNDNSSASTTSQNDSI